MADRELLMRCERAEAEGFFSLMTSVEDGAKGKLGISAIRIDGAPAWSCSAIPWVLFNRTIGLGLYEPCSSDTINQLAAFYGDQAHGVEASPHADNISEGALEASGYKLARSRPKFLRTSEPAELPEGISVHAAELSDADSFADVMAASFGFPEEGKAWMRTIVQTSHPGRVIVLAYVEGRLAGSAILVVTDGIGWLGGGCCLPEYRGKGVQRALIEARAGIASDMGATWITSETNADTADDPGYSYRNMVRSGFLHAFDRAQFVRG